MTEKKRLPLNIRITKEECECDVWAEDFRDYCVSNHCSLAEKTKELIWEFITKHKQGFDLEGIHKKTKTRFAPDGYDWEGYDERGFNQKYLHRDTGDFWNRQGEDVTGERGWKRSDKKLKEYERKKYEEWSEEYNKERVVEEFVEHHKQKIEIASKNGDESVDIRISDYWGDVVAGKIIKRLSDSAGARKIACNFIYCGGKNAW